MPKTLDAVALDQTVEITNISGSPFASKLTEMGLTKGQYIKAIFKAPFGDPIAFECNGNILSIRKEEASFIEIKVL
ncbi:MAG: hypothetical protein RLZZ65_420 [Bacteroidota bacterium]|jgi:Fe2+ transport system protein FeoA